MRAQTVQFPYWLLIGTVALVFALAGCSAPRSTAKIQTFSQQQKKLAEEKAKKSNNPQEKISQHKISSDKNFTEKNSLPEEKFVAANKDEDNLPVNPAPERKILTLREQMKKISDEQESIRKEQENITAEVVTTKQDIAKIKESLEDIKDVLRQMQSGKSPSAVRGIATEENIPGKGASIEPKKSNVIQPDNSLQKEESKSKSLAKNNVIQPDNIAKPAPKKKSPVINPDLAARYEGQATIVQKKKAKSVIAADPMPAVEKVKPAAIGEVGEKYQTAMSLFTKKKYSEVIPLLEDVAKKEKNPVKLSNTHYWLGESYFGSQNYDQALAQFQRVLSIRSAPKRDSAQVMIAECYNRKGNIAEAKKNYQKVLDVFPTSEYVPRAKKMLQQL